MSTISKIDFKRTPKVTWITSDIPDYDDFVARWNDWHDDGEEPPAEDSQAFYDFISEDQSIAWDDFRLNFESSPLIGKTCLFRGDYFSRYPDFQPSGVAGRVLTIESIDDFMKFTGDHPDHVNIWSDKDGLHVQNAHHDGTLTLTVKTLTKKGEAYWERMCRKDEGQSLECHKHLDETKGLSSPIDYYLF